MKKKNLCSLIIQKTLTILHRAPCFPFMYLLVDRCLSNTFLIIFFLMVCLFEIVGVFHSNITCFLKCFVFYSPQMDFSSYIFCTFRYIWVFFPLSPLCIHTYPIYTSLDPVCFRYFALIIFFPAYFLIRICRFFIAFPNHQRLQCLSCPSYLAVQLLTLDYRD